VDAVVVRRALGVLLAHAAAAVLAGPVPAAPARGGRPAAGPPAVPAAGRPDRVPPLAAPVPGLPLRGFDATAGPFGPGHRGVDLAAGTGSPVGAPAPGVVRFAGRVGRTAWVSLEVAPGVVVSLGPLLQPVGVRAGRPVGRGAPLGRLGPGHDGLHLGVRVDGRYVDPLPHLVRLGRPRLVPLPGSPPARGTGPGASAAGPAAAPPPAGTGSWPRPGGIGPAVAPRAAGAGDGLPAAGLVVGPSLGDTGARSLPGPGGRVGSPRSGGGLVRSLPAPGGARLPARRRGAGGAGLAARVRAGSLGTPVRLLAGQVRALPARLAALGGAALSAAALGGGVSVGILGSLRAACGTQALRARTRPPNANVAVGVAGLASSSETARDLDLTGLGFAPGDVVYFSYRGLPAPGDPGMEAAYRQVDTYGSLRAAAHRLYDQLAAVHAARPGRRVDLVAHSQGGLVAAYFLAYLYDPRDPLLPGVDHLVTLATPHQGADLATTVTHLRGTDRGRRLLRRLAPVARLLGFGVPADSVAVQQLAEDSRFIRQLRARVLVRATALRGGVDVVVAGRHGGRPELPGRVTCASHGGILRDGRARAAVVAALADQPLPPPAVGGDRLPRLLGGTLEEAEDQLGVVLERWAGVPAPAAP